MLDLLAGAAGAFNGWAAGVVGAIVGSIPAAWVAFYQGRKQAEEQRDDEIDRRLRTAENELTAVRTILSERRGKELESS